MEVVGKLSSGKEGKGAAGLKDLLNEGLLALVEPCIALGLR